MSLLRASTWVVSAALHGAVLVGFAAVSGNAAYEAGDGDDLMRVEQGIALEGFMKFGEAEETIEAVEAPPVQQAVEAPPIEELKPEELTNVISSEAAPPEEAVAVRDEPPPPPLDRPQQELKPVEEQLQQVAAIAQSSSAQAQSGGDANQRSAYLGKLRTHIEKHKINPHSRIAGTVVLQFTVDADGRLVESRITASSGSKLLDDAALAAIERAAPFPPFPTGIDGREMAVSLPFRFITR